MDLPSPRARRGGVLACAGVLVLLSLVPAAPASGHASSQLPHARWSAEGTEVVMQWTAAADDAADVAVAVGLWPEEAMWAYLDGDIEDMPDDDEVAALQDATVLHDYFAESVALRQAGTACPVEVALTDDFITDGAELTFACDEPVTEAEIEVTVLHDRDPDYRTFSVDGSEQYAVHTADQPRHVWDFTASGTDRDLPWGLVATGVGLVVALVALMTVVARRPRAGARS